MVHAHDPHNNQNILALPLTPAILRHPRLNLFCWQHSPSRSLKLSNFQQTATSTPSVVAVCYRTYRLLRQLLARIERTFERHSAHKTFYCRHCFRMNPVSVWNKIDRMFVLYSSNTHPSYNINYQSRKGLRKSPAHPDRRMFSLSPARLLALKTSRFFPQFPSVFHLPAACAGRPFPYSHFSAP